MCITITKEPAEFEEHNEDCEQCIFCDMSTTHWHEKSNRPVCVVCAKLFNDSDIDKAPFNY